jgi:tetratricopeptide (TPR) repeat protein
MYDADAIKAYRHAIDVELRFRKIEPERLTNPELHLKEMALLLKRGRTKEAIAAYKEAVSVASTPDEAGAYADLDSLHETHGKLPEAVQAYNEAVNRKPEWAEPHYALGLLYLKLGNRDLALNEQKILERLDPQMAQVLQNRIMR